MEELAIYEIENEIIDEQMPTVGITDDNYAEWCIRKIAEKRAELARYEMVCKNAIGVYQAKLTAMQEKTERDTANLIGMLRAYSETVPMKETKTQATYKLPSGTLKLKRGGYEYIRDEDALLPWVKANKPERIKVKESVDWAGLKSEISVAGSSVVDENGESVPGVTVAIKPDVFTVEV